MNALQILGLATKIAGVLGRMKVIKPAKTVDQIAETIENLSDTGVIDSETFDMVTVRQSGMDFLIIGSKQPKAPKNPPSVTALGKKF